MALRTEWVNVCISPGVIDLIKKSGPLIFLYNKYSMDFR